MSEAQGGSPQADGKMGQNDDRILLNLLQKRTLTFQKMLDYYLQNHSVDIIEQRIGNF